MPPMRISVPSSQAERRPPGRETSTVPVFYMPDVTVDLECHLVATSRGATLSGHLRGDEPFSRAAVAVFDWLKSERIRSCQLLSL
jgi:hypothetical protein